MKKHNLLQPVRKLVLEKKTIMKLNDAMMKRIEAGQNDTTGGKGDSSRCTGPSCDACGTWDNCISMTC